TPTVDRELTDPLGLHRRGVGSRLGVLMPDRQIRVRAARAVERLGDAGLERPPIAGLRGQPDREVVHRDVLGTERRRLVSRVEQRSPVHQRTIGARLRRRVQRRQVPHPLVGHLLTDVRRIVQLLAFSVAERPDVLPGGSRTQEHQGGQYPVLWSGPCGIAPGALSTGVLAAELTYRPGNPQAAVARAPAATAGRLVHIPIVGEQHSPRKTSFATLRLLRTFGPFTWAVPTAAATVR